MSKPNPKPTPSQPILSWTVHLARQRPLMTLMCLFSIGLVYSAGSILLGPYAALLAAVALVASLSEFLFPIKFIVTAEKVSCRMLLKSAEIRWADVKRCYVDDCGVKLSPLDRISRLEAFRGVYLRFANNESQVIETVKSLRPANA